MKCPIYPYQILGCVIYDTTKAFSKGNVEPCFFSRIWTLLAKPWFWCFSLEPALFDLLRVESSSNMKWKANAMLEGALASQLLPGVNVVFWRAPQHVSPPLKSSKMTTDLILLEYTQYRPQEGRWALIASLPYSYIKLGCGGSALFGMGSLRSTRGLDFRLGG